MTGLGRRGGACPLPGARKGRPSIRIDWLGGLERVDGGDVRVVERGQDLGFALEPGQPLGVGGNGFRQQLDCHLPAEPGVLGAIHLTHAAFAELGGDAEVGESLADHGVPDSSLAAI